MNNITNLFYKGTVNVKLHIGDKLIELNTHNSGLPYLQKAFCKFLTGYYEGEVDIPRNIDLRRNVAPSDPTSTWESYLAQKIQLYTEYPTYEDNNWVAIFTATINSSSLVDEIPEGDTAAYRLYLSTDAKTDGIPEHANQNDIAFIDISSSDLARIVPGTQAVVQWKMQLQNVNN